jgi:hypothetical protein
MFLFKKWLSCLGQAGILLLALFFYLKLAIG